MNYQVILFDADETLFDFKKTEEFALKKLINTLNTTYSEEYCANVYKEINTNIWKEFEEGKITSDTLKVERFQRFINTLNLKSDAKELSSLYVTYLADGSFLYKETEELLSYLHKKYKLSIITNGLADVQNKRIRNSIVNHYFEDVVISDEIKIAKPNPEIFHYALNNLNHSDKASVLMIGDSLTSDIKGGLNAGIDTCWCNLFNKTNNSDITPKYEINNLLDLKTIL